MALKNLYARLVLWLIRPAVQLALREEARQGSVLWRMQSTMPTAAQMAALGERIECVRATPAGGRR